MQTELIKFQLKGDERGRLVVLENNKEIPFVIKRIYYLFETKAGVRRGFHAHKKLTQLAVCVRGSCNMLMDNGYSSEVVELNDACSGLLIPPLVWHEMFDFSPDCVLMVLADDFYDESDYIRNYQEFRLAVNSHESDLSCLR